MPFNQSRKSLFKETLLQYRKDVFRVAYSWCHNNDLARELTQETLVKAMSKAESLRDMSAMKSWLFRILRNCWHDSYKQHVKMDDIDELDIAIDSESEDLVYQRQIKKRVMAAVNELSDEQRQVVTLVDLADMSYNDVANSLEIPVGTVMSRLYRARKHLRKYLQDLDINHSQIRPHVRRVK